MSQQQNLYIEVGGRHSIGVLVTLFYQKILADPDINDFFEGVDMHQVAKGQKCFLKYALGGENHYTGRDLRSVHARFVEEMGLGDKHFDIVIKHLTASLQEMEVPKGLISRVLERVESTRDDVLNR